MKPNQVLLFLLCLIFGLTLSACSKKMEEAASDSTVVADATSPTNSEMANATVAENEKLGTQWGDDVTSNVTSVDLERLSDEPVAQTSVRYANKNYQGKSVNSLSVASGMVSFAVRDDQGKSLPLVRDAQHYFLTAKEGQSYTLHYENHSDKTFEIVASVDGLDVLTGKEASKRASGYVLHPHQSLEIEGFRKSDSAVASFTFGKPETSYAANSQHGSIDNTGIIGTVVYELEAVESAAVDAADDGYAKAPNAFPADK